MNTSSPDKPRHPFLSLRSRFVIIALVLGFFSLFILFHWLYRQIAPRYLESMEESLVDTAWLLSSVIESDLPDDGSLPVTKLRRQLDNALHQPLDARIHGLHKEQIGLRVYLTDAHGMVLYDSEGRGEGSNYITWNDVGRTLRGEYGARATRTDPADPWSLTLHVAAPIRHNGKIIGVLSVGKPARAIFELAAVAQRKLLWLATAITLAGAVLVLIFAEIIVRPLERLRNYALAVRDGEDATLPKLPGRTLSEVGHALEQMRESLEGRKTIERYLQTLTHELKSPLAAIHGASELLGESMPVADRLRFYDNIRRETRRMQQIIEKLLQLSTLESRHALGGSERIDAGVLLNEAVDAVRRRATDKHITIEIKPCQSAFHFQGERFLVQQALGNLLENALDFTPEGGKVSLEIEAKEGRIIFHVRDTGPGIPPYAEARIFERFYSLPRPDTGRKSTGLGLALVREIAHLHRGEVSVANAPEGNGTWARLSFPA